MITDPAPHPQFDLLSAARAGLCIGLGFVAAKMVAATVVSDWCEMARILAGALAAAVVAALTTVVIECRIPQIRN
jgi:formate/nitrite transporter FocA (FNT family)